MATNVRTQATSIPTTLVVIILDGALESTSSSTKGKKKSRELVDQGHINKLVYDFSLFSKGRKNATLQLIPNKVWLNIYKDYLAQYPNSKFKEDSLKDHLHDNLKDMKSGVNNPKEV